jgi:hypothetical protein
MNAIELLAVCNSMGVLVEIADHEHIAVEPIDKLPLELINQLKQHKRDIIEYFNKRQPERIGTQPAANDDPIAPSPLQARALKGYYWRLGIKRDNLLKNSYTPDRAKVRLEEWRNDIGRIIGLSVYEVAEIEQELVSLGLLAIEGSWIIEGNGQPLTQCSNALNDQCLYDGTGRGFCEWLYTGETMH